ncbi:MAG TPA: hypothetical protein VIM11_02425 [Tepidisphaeraceae bacterium]|jgi:hypothetical protein
MQERERLDPADEEVEHLLTKLSPTAPSRLRASHVLFEAQRRRDRYQLWTWRGIAAALAIALIAQFYMKSVHHDVATGDGHVNPTVVVSTTTPHVGPTRNILADLTGDGYVATRNRSLAFGVPSITATGDPAAPPAPRLHAIDSKVAEPASFLELLVGLEPKGRS